jgi:hypothetical protein
MPDRSAPEGYDPHAEIFNLECAAWFCGQMSPVTLRRSTCPRSKPTGQLRFERSQLLAWFAAHRSHGVGEAA